MFFRKSATFAATDHDAEAIARIKQCPLWSHVEFVFHDDRDIRARLARIATALFRASEVERGLTHCVNRVEDNAGRITIHWRTPGPPSHWLVLFNAMWRNAGGKDRPWHYFV